MTRREELAGQALDYVMEHGLVGLSLRPLARAIGTSDRMLIYHFGTKEQLVSEVIEQAQSRLGSAIEPTGDITDLAGLIEHLWAGICEPASAQVTRLYLETCVLATQDPSRWGNAPTRLRAPWRETLQQGLVAFGVASEDVSALTDLILDTLDGLAIDRLVSADPARVDAAAYAFAKLLDR